MSIVEGRMTVDNSESVVVFLIGMKINRWWLLPLAWPFIVAMPRMLAELKKDPESGFLGVQSLGLVNMVQYWKSEEHLQRYAQAEEKAHRPAWLGFMKRVFLSRAMGIWHETYVVPAGRYEAVYGNMPKLGLGTFKPLVPATGALASAAGRLAPKEAAAGGEARVNAV